MMAKLTSGERKALPSKDFALPGRRYPIENASHARNALSRVSQNGSPAEKAEVRAKVHAKYPGIGRTKPTPEHAKRLAGALYGRS
jgi:hypothetical protein